MKYFMYCSSTQPSMPIVFFTWTIILYFINVTTVQTENPTSSSPTSDSLSGQSPVNIDPASLPSNPAAINARQSFLATSPARDQLLTWAKQSPFGFLHESNGPEEETIVSNLRGRPVPSMTASLKTAPQGYVLMADVNLIDHLSQFDRERIPERVVHAKGSGAYGEFIVTHDITKYTTASMFSHIGKKTDAFARFSSISGELGSADTLIDGRGYAVKFYTDTGVWNFLTCNIPVFPIRDPMLYPSLQRSGRKNPSTNMRDPNMFWDFRSLRPETLHHTMHLFSDFGAPASYRNMDGHGVSTFRLVNKNGNVTFCKFHLVTEQGLKNFTVAQASVVAGTNPEFYTEDLYNAIAHAQRPSWTLYVQIMTPEEARKYRWNPFDATKLIYEKDFPYIQVGRLTLTRNPVDYFTEVELSAFDSSDLIPGIEASQDPLFSGRGFAYRDTQRHRLGPNFVSIAINRPKNFDKLYTYERAGSCSVNNGDGGPNFFPNSFSKYHLGVSLKKGGEESPTDVDKIVDRYDTLEEDNYSQPRIFWEKMQEAERERLIKNMATGLQECFANIQERQLNHLAEIDIKLAQAVKLQIEKLNSEIDAEIEQGLTKDKELHGITK